MSTLETIEHMSYEGLKRVEPQVKAWLEKQFPESVSHGVNYILAEYMAKHSKGGRNVND